MPGNPAKLKTGTNTTYNMNLLFTKPVRNAIIISVVSALFISFATFLFVKKMRATYTSEVDIYLVEVAKQSASAIKAKMDIDLLFAENMAAVIGRDYNIQNVYGILSFMEKERPVRNYKRIGLVFPDGSSHLSNGMTWEEFSSYSVLTPEQMGKNAAFRVNHIAGKLAVSDKLYDRADATPIIVQNVPIFDNSGKFVASLFTTKALSEYKKEFAMSPFKGEGYFYLICEEGEILLNSGSEKAVLTVGENLFNAIEAEKPGYGLRLHEMVHSRQVRSTAYEQGGIRKYMSFVPVGLGDWYMFFVIDSGKINKKAYDLINFTVILGIVISILVLGIMFYMIKTAKKTEASLFELAYIDPLTKCGNINSLSKGVKEIMAKFPYKKFAFIMMDVDKFKIINNMYGGKQGNLILQHMSNVLDAGLHEGEIFGRIFADVFGVLIVYDDDKDILFREESLNEKLASCYALIDSHFNISFSFGIYKITERGLPFYTIMDRANLARVNSKKMPGQHLAFYNQFFVDDIIKQKFVENNIKKALEKQEIEIYLQPKYDIKTNKIAGAEALSRWVHPTKGIIRPDSFIPILERTGKIIQFDLYVLEQTAKIIRGWQDKGIQCVPVSINHSRLHLSNVAYPDLFKKIITDQGISTDCIELELTESAVLDNTDNLFSLIHRLHEHGFSCSMDDFGTGYSSLNVLKDLPVDIVKLDKVFLNDFNVNKKARDIITFAVQMIKKIGMKVVAEGIETEEQAAFLREIGCDYAQGYLFSKPVPARDFLNLLDKEK